jgi:putative FmdB family regulatory protein
MPIYDYICTCDKKETKEELQNISHPKPIYCSCGKEMNKTISNSSFQLKGSGWAKDSYQKTKTISTDES